MDRRSALGIGVAALLGACGGGGGSGYSPSPSGPTGSASAPSPAPAPAAAPAPTPTPTAALSPNIACWGDSLTPAFALNLQLMVPNRAVFNGGFLGQTSTVIAAQQMADATMTNWINVFWYGHNNDHDPATIKSDIAASIAHLAGGNSRFVVLSLLNKGRPDEIKGGNGYGLIVKLNADLAALYPNNYVDVRTWLVAHYDPNNPQDVIDDQDDVVPSSLRYDEIHLRNEGSVLVAQRVKQFLDAKGW